jgi:hypothetical protein
MARAITEQERHVAGEMLSKARAAMQAIEDYDQERVDRLCRAVASSAANMETATRQANVSVDECGMGGRDPTRRAKVLGILRDALRQKSMGAIEEIPEKGIVKYAKPAGVVAALMPNEHIHQSALVAPVSRIMVRQPQSASNAGTFTNGMPMTSSMGCGIWGGNSTNENVSLKHYMNVTWVSCPIPEDRPSDEELFGEFYNGEVF